MATTVSYKLSMIGWFTTDGTKEECRLITSYMIVVVLYTCRYQHPDFFKI